MCESFGCVQNFVPGRAERRHPFVRDIVQLRLDLKGRQGSLPTAQSTIEGRAHPSLLAPPRAAGDCRVEEEPAGSMGGSGAWLIPLLAIGLIALAVSQNDDPPPPPL